MTGIVDWSLARMRMICALIVLSVLAGYAAYVNLPKEGSPNIDIPALYITVTLPGASAADAERLLVKPLETKLRGLEGLKEIKTFASESHASAFVEFDFGWNKTQTLADVRDKVDQAQAEMPLEAEEPRVIEINLSQFPILVVSLSGEMPQRTLLRLADDLQRELESISSVLEVGIAGYREEMLEVVINPAALDTYDVTARELINAFQNNNRLVAAGSVDTQYGSFSLKLPGAFETSEDVYSLPVKVDGERVVTVRDIAEVRRTFEDQSGTARLNGDNTVALQVKKRTGENIIHTVEEIEKVVERVTGAWPTALKQNVNVSTSMNEASSVKDMVDQLESSVLTAVLLVLIVVIVSLGFRSAILVGVAIPCSFLLSFAILAAFGMSVNNMVMFGLILAVGMLVDGAIIVTEYADRRLSEGARPNDAYGEAAKRMFWPIISSTATTLCAFLPMLFWPGTPGQFMRYLPITLIFVLGASLVVALIFLPVLGRLLAKIRFRKKNSHTSDTDTAKPVEETGSEFAAKIMSTIVLRPWAPFVVVGCAVGFFVGVLMVYIAFNNGTEFFVETEPERANLYVRAIGNLSVNEKDMLVQHVEKRIEDIDGIQTIFAFAGEGGLNQQGGEKPQDSVGTIQLEFAPWYARRKGALIINDINERIKDLPGIYAELSEQKDGPQQGKPVQVQVSGTNWDVLLKTVQRVRDQFEATPGLVNIDDTRPLPGIDWELTVDRAQAGRFGADISTIGTLIQLVTRGTNLGSYRPDDADEELDIRARYPEEQRVVSTFDQMKIRTNAGLVPLSNFVERTAVPRVNSYSRIDGKRYFLVRADIAEGENANAKIGEISAWLQDTRFDPGIDVEVTGDQEEQNESQAFLQRAMFAALGLMFTILLAQFNSIYNSVLVLSAVVLSVAGVLIGMLVMGQTFSIIMTGTGIVALAGIVVNNNIVLIDTFQELNKKMPVLDSIIKTVSIRVRPVLLTTITTMAGLMPMMFAISIDFKNFTLAQGTPTGLWWVQLSTAVVFGLGVSTFLTLLVTPSALAARVWIVRGVKRLRNRGYEGKEEASVSHDKPSSRSAEPTFTV